MAPSELPLLYLSASLSLSLCALINGHSFSSAFFLFFLLFTAPLPQLDTLHLVQSPNILTAVAVSCDVNCDVSAHGELQLCIEVCTQSVKYFGHPSGTTSFRLCRCQLGGKGTGSARQGRRFVACTGLHGLLTPLTLSSLLSLLLPLCCLQCFSLAMHIFPFFNLLLLLLVCFLSLLPSLSVLLCPRLAEGKLFGVSSAAHQFLLLTSKSCNALSRPAPAPAPGPPVLPRRPQTHTRTLV